MKKLILYATSKYGNAKGSKFAEFNSIKELNGFEIDIAMFRKDIILEFYYKEDIEWALPKVKNKKLIKKNIGKLAKRVSKSFEEEDEYKKLSCLKGGENI